MLRNPVIASSKTEFPRSLVRAAAAAKLPAGTKSATTPGGSCASGWEWMNFGRKVRKPIER